MLRSHKFGAKIRKLVVAALKAKKALYECPACLTATVILL